MNSRLVFGLIVILTVCVGLVRFSVGVQGPWIDATFLSLAVATIVLGVRNWADMLTKVRNGQGWNDSTQGQ